MSPPSELDALNEVANATTPETRVSLNLHAYIALMHAQKEVRDAIRDRDELALRRGAQSMAASLDAIANGGCWLHHPGELPKR